MQRLFLRSASNLTRLKPCTAPVYVLQQPTRTPWIVNHPLHHRSYLLSTAASPNNPATKPKIEKLDWRKTIGMGFLFFFFTTAKKKLNAEEHEHQPDTISRIWSIFERVGEVTAKLKRQLKENHLHLMFLNHPTPPITEELYLEALVKSVDEIISELDSKTQFKEENCLTRWRKIAEAVIAVLERKKQLPRRHSPTVAVGPNDPTLQTIDEESVDKELMNLMESVLGVISELERISRIIKNSSN